EHVERDLQALLLENLLGRVRRPAGLVVLHDSPRAERLDVDAVDLPRERHAVADVEPTERGALAAERDLVARWDERKLRRGLRAPERLEVAPERLVELLPLQLGELHPHALQGLVEAAAEERQSALELRLVEALDAELLRNPAEKPVQRGVR